MACDPSAGKEVAPWELFSCMGAGGPGCEGMMLRCCSGIQLWQRHPWCVSKWQMDLGLNPVSATLTGGFTTLRLNAPVCTKVMLIGSDRVWWGRMSSCS